MARKVLQTNIPGRSTSSSFPKISGLTGGDQGEETPLRGQPHIKVVAQKIEKWEQKVVDRRHVLTAAHCMDEVELKDIPDLLSVVLGLHDLREVPDLSK